MAANPALPTSGQWPASLDGQRYENVFKQYLPQY